MASIAQAGPAASEAGALRRQIYGDRDARRGEAGAREAGYVTLRLPLEIREIFREWLSVHFPDKLKRSLSMVQSMHGGKDYDSQWGRRMAGSGPYAWMIGRRFEIAAQRLGYRKTPEVLRSDLFESPLTAAGNAAPRQLSLF